MYENMLGSKKMLESKKMLGSKKILGSKKCLGLKKKNLCPKNVGVWNFLGYERNLASKRFVKKNSSKKNFVGKR